MSSFRSLPIVHDAIQDQIIRCDLEKEDLPINVTAGVLPRVCNVKGYRDLEFFPAKWFPEPKRPSNAKDSKVWSLEHGTKLFLVEQKNGEVIVGK